MICSVLFKICLIAKKETPSFYRPSRTRLRFSRPPFFFFFFFFCLKVRRRIVPLFKQKVFLLSLGSGIPGDSSAFGRLATSPPVTLVLAAALPRHSFPHRFPRPLQRHCKARAPSTPPRSSKKFTHRHDRLAIIPDLCHGSTPFPQTLRLLLWPSVTLIGHCTRPDPSRFH